MTENFDKCCEWVLQKEDYWSDIPTDPGGLTIWGISTKSHPQDVDKMKTMSKEDSREYAKPIYKASYWDVCNCDALHWPLDFIVFDSAVQHGPARAGQFLQNAKIFADYYVTRLAFYNGIHDKKHAEYNTCIHGWINRLLDLYSFIKLQEGV